MQDTETNINELTSEQQQAKFFKEANFSMPKTCTAIVWLSPKFFTESQSSNQEFKEAFPTAKYSLSQIIKHNFMCTSDVSLSIQRGKFINGEESYRPYVLFYNQPTKCYWVAPLSTSYNFEENPNNPSYYELDTRIYCYIPTNVKMPERTVVETSRSIPVSQDMLNFKLIDLNKITESPELDKYISKNFTENTYFKSKIENTLNPFYLFHRNDQNQPTYISNSYFGLFMLQFFRQKADILANKLCQTHTTTSSLDLVRKYEKSYEKVCAHLYKLEDALLSSIQANNLLNEIVFKYANVKVTTQKAEEITKQYRRAEGVAMHYAAAVAKNVGKINACLTDMGIFNISHFDYDMLFTNYFCTNALTPRAKFNPHETSEKLSSYKEQLKAHLSSLEKKYTDEQKAKKEKENQKMLADENAKRNKQSEKDKRTAKEAGIKSALHALEKIRSKHYDRTDKFNFKDLFDNLQELSHLKDSLDFAITFLTKEHSDTADNAIAKTLLNIEPTMVSDLNEMKNVLNALSSNLDAENCSTLFELIKQKTVRENDLDEKTIKLLNNDSAIAEILQSVTNLNANLAPVKETIDLVCPSVKFFEEIYKPNIAEESTYLEKAKNNVIRTIKLLGLKLESEPKIQTTEFIIDKITNCANIDELTKLFTDLADERKGLFDDQAKISILLNKIETNFKVSEHLKLDIEEKRKLSEKEMSKIISDKLKSLNSELLYGSHPVDIDKPHEYFFESKFWHALIKYDPKPVFINSNEINNLEALTTFLKDLELHNTLLDISANFDQYFGELMQTNKKMNNLIDDQIDKAKRNLKLIGLPFIHQILDTCKSKKNAIEILGGAIEDGANEYILEVLDNKDSAYGKHAPITLLPFDKNSYSAERIRCLENVAERFHPCYHIDKCGNRSLTSDALMVATMPSLMRPLLQNQDGNVSAENFVNGKLKFVRKNSEDGRSVLHSVANVLGDLEILTNQFILTYQHKSFTNLAKQLPNKLNTDKRYLEKIAKNIEGTDADSLLLAAALRALKPIYADKIFEIESEILTDIIKRELHNDDKIKLLGKITNDLSKIKGETEKQNYLTGLLQIQNDKPGVMLSADFRHKISGKMIRQARQMLKIKSEDGGDKFNG